MLGAQQPDIVLLDVVGVRDVGRPLLPVERLELGVRLVLGEQHVGSVPGRGLLHCSLPFSFETIVPRFFLSKAWSVKGLLCHAPDTARFATPPNSIRRPALKRGKVGFAHTPPQDRSRCALPSSTP